MTQPLHMNTPLLRSLPLAAKLHPEAELWLKMDALQPAGSFKIRGIGYACQQHAAQGATQFLTSSGGNAGLAVAYAGRMLGLQVLVIVPRSTSARAIALIEREGARVQVEGATWQEAHEHALSLAAEDPASTYIHPFDDPLLWTGHASLIDEVCEAGLRPDALVVSVGGGGLLCGMIEGLHRNDLADIPVFAVETQGADSLAAALQAGELVTLPDITSLATTLGAKRVAEKAFAWCQTHDVTSVVVSDKAAVDACVAFANEHRVLVEPSCGAALAAVADPVEGLRQKRRILVIACGGAAVTLTQLQSWQDAVEAH